MWLLCALNIDEATINIRVSLFHIALQSPQTLFYDKLYNPVSQQATHCTVPIAVATQCLHWGVLV
jgi:hypothetical protein